MSASFMPDPGWPSIIEMATKLWGAENKAYSSKDDIRFGSKGSKSVWPSRNVWNDYESNDGGGYLDLYVKVYGELPARPNEDGRIPPWDDIDTTYPYCDRDGVLLFEVVRTISGAPRFRQRRPNGTGRWKWEIKDAIPATARPPYRLPELLAAPQGSIIFIPEGEKDVDNIYRRKLIATCNVGGAAKQEDRAKPYRGKWLPHLSEYLRGRDVCILPDNDEAGETHALDIARKLSSFAQSVKILKLPGLSKKGGDVSDWFKDGNTAEQLIELAKAAPSYRVANDADEDIIVIAGKRHEAADAGLAAMKDAGVQFYIRDKSLVRVCRAQAKASNGTVTTTPAIVPVTLPMIGRALGQSSVWKRFDAKGELYRIDPPKDVVEQISSMVGEWPFPPLAGIINTPTLRPDGSLLSKPGYDPATGYFLFDPPSMPGLSERPSRRDAETALAILRALYAEFPFVDEPSKSVAISMVMTPVLRCALTVVPMHTVSAPTSGTGKTHLLNTASAVATGDQCAVIAMARKPDETEKRLITAALSQQPIIAIDNVSELLLGDFLCQVTEQPWLRLRPLGTNNDVRASNSFTVFANGNNLVIGADNVRRTIQCSLDAQVEDPETRKFSGDPVATALANRGKYVAAILTIALAYRSAGMPERLPPTPSYGAWSNYVRSPLVWLGMADPVETIASLRNIDPIRQARAAVFKAWAAELKLETWYRTGELAEVAEEWLSDQGRRRKPELWEALFAIAPAEKAQKIEPRKLGRWLVRNTKNIAAGYCLCADASDASRLKYQLVSVVGGAANAG